MTYFISRRWSTVIASYERGKTYWTAGANNRSPGETREVQSRFGPLDLHSVQFILVYDLRLQLVTWFRPLEKMGVRPLDSSSDISPSAGFRCCQTFSVTFVCRLAFTCDHRGHCSCPTGNSHLPRPREDASSFFPGDRLGSPPEKKSIPTVVGNQVTCVLDVYEGV